MSKMKFEYFKNGLFYIVCSLVIFGFWSCGTDACESIDCGPNGSCDDGICICVDGYTGPNCSINVRIREDSLALVALYNSTNGSAWTEQWDLSQPMSSWFGVDLGPFGTVERLEIAEDINMTGVLPPELGNLSDILLLELRRNQIGGSIPTELRQLTKLQCLRFDENQVEGSVPAELSQIASLKKLDLANNKLSGTIPAELGDLGGLDFLDLSDNALTGTIPAELENLQSLVFLTLRSNQLEGCFPAGFSKLCNVFGVDVSSNQQMPWGGDFDRFCSGEPQIGAPCMINGQAGVIGADCTCVN